MKKKNSIKKKRKENQVKNSVVCTPQATPGDMLSCPALKEERECIGTCTLFFLSREASPDVTSAIEAYARTQSRAVAKAIAEAGFY